jgi:hypothetical protein
LRAACSVQDDESALRQETAGSKQIAANDLVSCKYAVTICGELLERLQANGSGDNLRRQSIRQVAERTFDILGNAPRRGNDERALSNGTKLRRISDQPIHRKKSNRRVGQRTVQDNAAFANDIRACVTKHKIPVGTMNVDGRIARDTMPGLMKTCTLASPFSLMLAIALRVVPQRSPSYHLRFQLLARPEDDLTIEISAQR